MKSKTLFLSAILFATNVWSANISPSFLSLKNNVGLLFPAELNGVKVLPQRFEYTLYNGYLLKLGDILMDTNQVQFKIVQDKTGQSLLRFQWPAGLFKDGEVLIKNNNGKTIWSSNFHGEDLKVNPGQAIEEFKDLRNEFAEWTSEPVSPSLIESMKYLPFVNFCIDRKDDETWISLCSPELYFGMKEGKAVIKTRASNRRESLIQINSKRVSDQGIIFLNDPNEKVSLRAMIQSGANIEVETKMRKIDFLDVTQEPNQPNVSILMYGTDPIHESDFQKIEENFWRLSLDAARPFLYVKGQSGIPMRQEFYVAGKAPPENLRVQAKRGTRNKTYESSVSMTVRFPAQAVARPEKNNITIEKKDKDLSRLTLNNLEKGKLNARQVIIQSEKDEFKIQPRIFRGYDSTIAAVAPVSIVPSKAALELHYEHWFETFLFTDWMFQSLGASLDYGTGLLKPSDYPNFSYVHAQLLWRANPGLNGIDPTWGLSLPIWMHNFAGQSSTSLGLGAFYEKDQIFPFLKYFDWNRIEGKYALSNSGDIKVSALGSIYFTGYKKWTSNSFWSTGLGASTAQVEGANKSLNLDVVLGAHYQF